MISAIIKFNKPEDINEFVKNASKCEFDIDIKRGSTILDGKSIEGLYAMQLCLELECVVHESKNKAEEFISKIQRFIVKDFE